MNQTVDISGVVLRSDRLTLRPWRDSDLADLYAYARVDGVGQMAGWNPHSSMEESRKILDMFLRERKVFALEYQGKVIGSLGVEKYNETFYPEFAALRGREIGYVLAKAHWGKGLMPEAVKRVLRYLFEEEKLDFVMAGHFDHNDRSRRVIEKCGFHYIKTVPFETSRGTVESSVDYVFYKEDWRKEHAEA